MPVLHAWRIWLGSHARSGRQLCAASWNLFDNVAVAIGSAAGISMYLCEGDGGQALNHQPDAVAVRSVTDVFRTLARESNYSALQVTFAKGVSTGLTSITLSARTYPTRTVGVAPTAGGCQVASRYRPDPRIEHLRTGASPAPSVSAASASFGKITSQANRSRLMQLSALRILRSSGCASSQCRRLRAPIRKLKAAIRSMIRNPRTDCVQAIPGIHGRPVARRDLVKSRLPKTVLFKR